MVSILPLSSDSSNLFSKPDMRVTVAIIIDALVMDLSTGGWWSPLVLLFPSPPVPLPTVWWLYWVYQLQLVSPSPSYSTVCLFFLFSRKIQVLIFLFAFFQVYSVLTRDGKVHYSAGSFFFCLVFLLSLGQVVWPRLGDLYVSQNP